MRVTNTIRHANFWEFLDVFLITRKVVDNLVRPVDDTLAKI